MNSHSVHYDIKHRRAYKTFTYIVASCHSIEKAFFQFIHVILAVEQFPTFFACVLISSRIQRGFEENDLPFNNSGPKSDIIGTFLSLHIFFCSHIFRSGLFVQSNDFIFWKPNNRCLLNSCQNSCEIVENGKGHSDLDIWSTDLKINRGHLLSLTNLHVKSEDPRAKCSWCNKWKPFGLLTDRPTWEKQYIKDGGG